MDYIQRMRELNISFQRLDEAAARQIMETRFSFFSLLEYGALFDRYRETDRQGQFVALDFSQLYALAQLDEKLRYIVMTQCLELEHTLKTILVNRVCSTGESGAVLAGFIRADREYLLRSYTPGSSDIMAEKYGVSSIECLSFPQFLDVIHFGTLPHLWSFIGQSCPGLLEGYESPAFLNHIVSVKRIRNMAAHNIALLSQLPIKCENRTHDVSVFLSRNGMKNKTLHTNMTKALVNDYCALLHLYHLIQPPEKRLACWHELRSFLSGHCIEAAPLFEDNFLLKSTHTFLCRVIEIYQAASAESYQFPNAEK